MRAWRPPSNSPGAYKWPPSRQLELVADLEQDPFVSSALQIACCELYYRYGMYLAPLTAALTTAKHCDWGRVEDNAFNQNTPPSASFEGTNDGRSERTGASRASEAIETTNNCESERPYKARSRSQRCCGPPAKARSANSEVGCRKRRLFSVAKQLITKSMRSTRKPQRRMFLLNQRRH